MTNPLKPVKTIDDFVDLRARDIARQYDISPMEMYHILEGLGKTCDFLTNTNIDLSDINVPLDQYRRTLRTLAAHIIANYELSKRNRFPIVVRETKLKLSKKLINVVDTMTITGNGDCSYHEKIVEDLKALYRMFNDEWIEQIDILYEKTFGEED